jgi:hypothetical protein
VHGSLSGARMLKIEESGCYVAPYIDEDGAASERGKFLVIDSHGEIECQNTNGLSKERGVECENCGDRYDREDEGSYIDSRDENWCDCCTSEHAFYCKVTSRTIANADGVQLANGDYVSERNFERNGFTCEGTDEKYMDQDYMVVLHDGTVWHQDYFADHGFQCDDCGECFSNEDKHDLVGKDCTENTCLACAGDAADIEPDTDAEVPTVPATRKHVARQGRDNLPGQLELVIPAPAKPPGKGYDPTFFPNACVGDMVSIINVGMGDPEAPDGHYVITAIERSDSKLDFQVCVHVQNVWVFNRHVANVYSTRQVAA